MVEKLSPLLFLFIAALDIRDF